jgi:hypothetical protein
MHVYTYNFIITHDLVHYEILIYVLECCHMKKVEEHWLSGKSYYRASASNLYSGGAQFKYQPGHQL